MISNITDNIKYIGVDDTDIDLFESQYIVPNGISYNSYLIEDEKIAVMDTVDRRKSQEWWSKLEEALAGRTPDYLIVQHMEPDHAGNIAAMVQKFPELKIVASAKAIQMMPQFFGRIIFVRVINFNIHIKIKANIRVSVTGYHLSLAAAHKMILKGEVISNFVLQPMNNFKQFISHWFPFVVRNIFKIVHNHNFSFHLRLNHYSISLIF